MTTPPGEYRQARIGAAIALTITTCVLLILDAVLPDYDIQPAETLTLAFFIGGLLGVEIKHLRRGD